jgi:hypothetical protein
MAALRAGVDLMLISYDGSHAYEVLAELARAHASLAESLKRSDARLDRLSEFLSAAAPPSSGRAAGAG